MVTVRIVYIVPRIHIRNIEKDNKATKKGLPQIPPPCTHTHTRAHTHTHTHITHQSQSFLTCQNSVFLKSKYIYICMCVCECTCALNFVQLLVTLRTVARQLLLFTQFCNQSCSLNIRSSAFYLVLKNSFHSAPFLMFPHSRALLLH